MRERGAHHEMRMRKIWVGFDRPSRPRDRLLPAAELVHRGACVGHPNISHRIPRTKAQGLKDVSLRFFGATHEKLANPNSEVSGGKIPIQRQRMFTFADALCSAACVDADKSQHQMAVCMVRDQSQGFGQFGFGCRQSRDRLDRKGQCSCGQVCAGRSNERPDIVRIRGERALEKAATLRDAVRGQTLIEQGQSLEIEVH